MWGGRGGFAARMRCRSNRTMAVRNARAGVARQRGAPERASFAFPRFPMRVPHLPIILDARAVAGVLGSLVFFAGVALLGPAVVGALYGETQAMWSFVGVGAGSMALGGGLWRAYGRPEQVADLGIREGFTIVALAWLVLSLVGALPFTLGGVLPSYTDAFFETMSGFTTTGATILGGAETPAIEAVPNAHLFWRSLTHWLGGMGIIVLTLAILPILGVGGMQLFKAEVPGPSADKLTPRVRETAKRLWLIYVALTGLQILLLLPAMSFFDAINHAFATMATGGFSTENGSVGQYESAYVDWVITAFMVLAGINFALHYRLFHRGGLNVWKDTELRVYFGILLAATAMIVFATWQPTYALLPAQSAASEGTQPFPGYISLADAARYGAFQVAAIVTTTGFGTADYELWPALAVFVVFGMFFVGGMAGSTGGGIKVVRQVLLFKNSYKEVKQLVHPHAILTVRINDRVVPREILKNVLSFIVLYFGLIGVGTLVMSFCGFDLLSAFSASFSSVGNVGPAFGAFGPTETYAPIPAFGKWTLALLMMAGRLEIFTVLLLFVPTFWRR